MAKRAQKTAGASGTAKRPIRSYDHKGKKRANNPPVGLVTPETDPDAGQKKTYQYDPHLDPQLVWAGKAEHTSFSVPTVSLHVHERIDPRTIIEATRRRNGQGVGGRQGDPSKGASGEQVPMFEQPDHNPPLREAIEFYKHAKGWTNRLIAGDSLLVMNSLLEKEGMAGKVQMVYIDPPYGIRYGSNFQPFVNKRDVKDGKDDDLTQEPEMIRAFRDTWELGIHSYLTYLRDRLLLARELLHESGSCFMQISDENLHLVRNLMDEVFGVDNFCAGVVYQKTGGFAPTLIARNSDFILWYARDKAKAKYHQLYEERAFGAEDTTFFDYVEHPDGSRRPLTSDERKNPALIPADALILARNPLTSDGYVESLSTEYSFGSERFRPTRNAHWKTTREGMKRLEIANRLITKGQTLRFVRYLRDFPVKSRTCLWTDTGTGGFVGDAKVYVVQTDSRAIARCLLMTTDPGDLVLDPTCGSGTTAYVAEQWGRRWITCDTSRVSIALAKQRLMTPVFDYYDLAHPDEGVGSGFTYKTVPHIMLKSIANNPEIKEGMGRKAIDAAIAKYADQETLYDQPTVDKSKARVSGPFTVEAVPAPAVKSIADCGLEVADSDAAADSSVGRSGETLRQDEWRDELLKCGIRGKTKQHIHFSRVETLSGTRWLHADAETTDDTPERVVVSFGPEHAPLEQRQVAAALEEAQLLVPKPKMVVFASFQFDPEAAKDIDETNWPGITLLKVQMNTDLLTEDLKKKRSSNESFWMIGQPDVQVRKVKDGDDKGKIRIEVCGFDYYNPIDGKIESGDTSKIAMWMLDTDYDGRSLYPSQVFFPIAGEKDGWSRLAKNLKAEIDEELIEAYRGTVSLPFEPGDHKRAAVKIIDDRGIESLKILELT